MEHHSLFRCADAVLALDDARAASHPELLLHVAEPLVWPHAPPDIAEVAAANAVGSQITP